MEKVQSPGQIGKENDLKPESCFVNVDLNLINCKQCLDTTV